MNPTLSFLFQQLYQSLRQKPKKEGKSSKFIHAVDLMDINSKDQYSMESYNATKAERNMSKSLNLKDLDRTVSMNGQQHSQKFFMMYSTENGDGTTTSVAFGGMTQTNVDPQFRTKQPRNIVTNSSQSMFAGGQR